MHSEVGRLVQRSDRWAAWPGRRRPAEAQQELAEAEAEAEAEREGRRARRWVRGALGATTANVAVRACMEKPEKDSGRRWWRRLPAQTAMPKAESALPAPVASASTGMLVEAQPFTSSAPDRRRASMQRVSTPQENLSSRPIVVLQGPWPQLRVAAEGTPVIREGGFLLAANHLKPHRSSLRRLRQQAACWAA